MVRRVQDLITQRAANQFVGRDEELAALLSLLERGEPLVVHIHGIAGIGKSSLLNAVHHHARERGTTVIRIDCRIVEPTVRGFLQALGTATGIDTSDPREAADRLGALGDSVLLTFDTYELFRLMDTWLRQTFVPQLPDTVRIVMAGREPPVSAWWSSPGWQGLFRSITLGPIDEPNAIDFLTRSGFPPHDARKINRTTRGHPLALQLAASTLNEHPDLDLEIAATQRVVDELTRLYLRDAQDALTRRTLEASSVVRRVTLPLIAAMFPNIAPQDAYERLRSLPFVELVGDGLHVHDAVQQAIATSLRASDPERYRQLRRAAWQVLQSEVRTASPHELWRYTADMLYIIENPIIREAFFPSDSQRYVYAPASDVDDCAIREIITSTEGPESAYYLTRSWEAAAHMFHVGRNPNHAVEGFYCLSRPEDIDERLLRTDPLLRLWQSHLQQHPLPRGQIALFCRRWLSRECGELPSPVQGAAWLDLKRTYMELRPRLRRIYMTIWDIETYGDTGRQLGFELLPGEHVTLDSRTYYSLMNDFGPNSVDGWLAGLVGLELGERVQTGILDVAGRQLLVSGDRVALTNLEFGTLHFMHARAGQAISREELLAEVWGDGYAGGSNVVDTIIRSLRKKLGNHATAIETVWGTGYRYREP